MRRNNLGYGEGPQVGSSKFGDKSDKAAGVERAAHCFTAASAAALEARPVICLLGTPAGVSSVLKDAGFTLTGVQMPALGDEKRMGTVAAPIGTSAQTEDVLVRLGFSGPGSSVCPRARSRSKSSPSHSDDKDLAERRDVAEIDAEIPEGAD